MIDAFTIIAWIVLAVLFLVAVVAIVYLGSLPGSIAKKRKHPQADAINAASWIGLALLGAGWPIAFVWAFVKNAPVGSEASDAESDSQTTAEAADEQPSENSGDGDASENKADLESIAGSLAAIERRLTAIEEKQKRINP